MSKKYFVKSHFNGWCEVSEENYKRFIENIIQRAGGMNDKQKQQYINRVTKTEPRTVAKNEKM